MSTQRSPLTPRSGLSQKLRELQENDEESGERLPSPSRIKSSGRESSYGFVVELKAVITFCIFLIILFIKLAYDLSGKRGLSSAASKVATVFIIAVSVTGIFAKLCKYISVHCCCCAHINSYWWRLSLSSHTVLFSNRRHTINTQAHDASYSGTSQSSSW